MVNWFMENVLCLTKYLAIIMKNFQIWEHFGIYVYIPEKNCYLWERILHSLSSGMKKMGKVGICLPLIVIKYIEILCGGWILFTKKFRFWELDYAWEGFRWNVVDDYSNNVLAFTRRNKLGEEILVRYAIFLRKLWKGIVSVCHIVKS